MLTLKFAVYSWNLLKKSSKPETFLSIEGKCRFYELACENKFRSRDEEKMIQFYFVQNSEGGKKRG